MFGGMHFQCFCNVTWIALIVFVFCPPRFQAIAGLGSFSRRRAAFRSHDVSVTAVTSQVAHTTGPSDVWAYDASVPKVVAPSHVGPRSRNRPAAFEFGGPRKYVICSHAT